MNPFLDFFDGPWHERDMFGPDGKLLRFHKGASVPRETTAQKRQAKLQEKLLKAQLEQIKKQSHMEMPAMPPAPEPPGPPPTQTANDMSQAEMDARRQAAKRKGLLRSVVAGERRQTMAGSAALT
jgi:hypothetical protein